MIHRLVVSGFAAFLWLHAYVSCCPAEMVVRDLDTNRHDRFQNNPATFVGSATVAGFDLDFSGVARASTGQWVTMVSERHFVTATHLHPSAGSLITFHHDNNPLGVVSTATVSGGVQIGSTDIWVGTLTAPIAAGVAVYPIAADINYMGQIAYQVGLNSGNLGADNTTNFRVGRNRVTDVLTDVTLSGTYTTTSVRYFDDSAAGDLSAAMAPTANLIADETFFQGGDSGGPSFLLSSVGELILLGTHSFVSDPGDTDRLFSGDAYLPAYRGQIIAAIPEPGAWRMWAVVALLVTTVRQTGLLLRLRGHNAGMIVGETVAV